MGAGTVGGEGGTKHRRVRVEVLDNVGLVLMWGVDEKFVWDGSDKGRTLAQVLAIIAAS